MAGRIEAYIHSDSVVSNKGACLVEVRCQTDFAARTEPFVAFARKAAKLMFGYGATCWKDLVEQCPALDDERRRLEAELKERVLVGRVAALRLDDGAGSRPDREIEAGT
ncbi:MAG: hypothetical protein ACYC6Y_31445 [Thermoguttaceae bacterium]